MAMFAFPPCLMMLILTSGCCARTSSATQTLSSRANETRTVLFISFEVESKFDVGRVPREAGGQRRKRRGVVDRALGGGIDVEIPASLDQHQIADGAVAQDIESDNGSLRLGVRVQTCRLP